MRIIQTSRAIALLAAVGAGATPALAAPWKILGNVVLRGGVESNPYLNDDSSGATGSGSVSVNATASQETARATTSILANAQLTQYASRYGRNTNFLIGVSRTQALSEALSLNGGATYTSTLNPQSNFGFDPTVQTATIDYLTIGTRSERIDGYLNVDWRASDKDVFRGGVTGSRQTYGGSIANTNNQYGANFSYLRTINARTSLGVQLSAAEFTGADQPSSQSFQGGLLVVHRFSAIWLFDGGISLIRQRSNGFLASNRSTIGFNGSLCGTYPRSSVCAAFSRQSAPSGIGGLRTDTRFSLSGSHSLTARSRVNGIVSYNLSNSLGVAAIPRQRYYDATLGYSRDIGPRIAIGADGRYQRRQTNGASGFIQAGTVSSYTVTANISYSFGHRGS